MKKRSDYINRVRAGIVFNQAMEAMEDNGALVFEYGSRGKFEIHCSIYGSGMRTYSIGEHDQMFGSRMNIDLEKSSKVALHLYTYDLFSNKTTVNLNYEHIKIIK
jgi:hypothetical protein